MSLFLIVQLSNQPRSSLNWTDSSTGNLYKAVPRFGEFWSCCCLPLLHQLACNILATWERPYTASLYIPDPPHGHPLVEEAGVADDALLAAQVEEAEGGGSVVDGGHDDGLLRGQNLGVVDVEGGGAARKGAAVDPQLKHHKEQASCYIRDL